MQGGLGDVVFSLKLIETLQKHQEELKKQGYSDDIVFVLKYADKSFAQKENFKTPEKIIELLLGNKSWPFRVLSQTQYFDALGAKSITPECLIVGPTLPSCLNISDLLPENSKNPILLMSEYSAMNQRTVDRKRTALEKKDFNVSCIFTGFRGDKGGPFPEQGIFINNMLSELAKQKLGGNFSFREKAWQELPLSLSENLLQNMKLEEYHHTHELFMVYSNQPPGKFLINQLELFGSLTKNQDIVMIGPSNPEDLCQEHRDLFQQKGFEVVFIDLNKNPPETKKILDSYDHKKQYRIFYLSRVSKVQMQALMSLSNDFIGVTGDQSFGEAFSAGKLISYETLFHKQGFIDGFWAKVKEKATEPMVAQLVKYLSGGWGINPPDLVKNSEIAKKLQKILLELQQDYNLESVIIEALNKVSPLNRLNSATPSPPKRNSFGV
jgi:hypothetical protein